MDFKSVNKTNFNDGSTRSESDDTIFPEKGGFILRQLFDHESCTYTYLLGDKTAGEAVLIDSVFHLAERDKRLIEDLQLKLKFVMNTHVHADHVTGSGLIKLIQGYKYSLESVISVASGADADRKVKHGDLIPFGKYSLEVRHTPGHTNGCVCYVFHEGRMVFTGDTVLIRGCGRVDMQGGDAKSLYSSVHSQVFTLPEDYLIYPAHDYKGMTCSTVGEEKKHNPRLAKTLDEFIIIMENLGLPYPKMIDVAVPANKVCGLWELPPEMEEKLQAAKQAKD